MGARRWRRPWRCGPLAYRGSDWAPSLLTLALALVVMLCVRAGLAVQDARTRLVVWWRALL